MKRYIYIILSAMMLVGCVKEPVESNGTPGDGKTIKATFTLSPDFVEEITVRSVDGVNERVISDLWVIQLSQDGTTQLQDPQYITTGITAGTSDYKVTVSLKRSASRVYFIANTHDKDIYKDKTNTAAVEAVTMNVTAEANLASATGIPMAGAWAGTPDLLGIVGQVSLSRAVAKVNFNLNATLPNNERFYLKSITVKQVPNSLNYYRDAATLDTYPYPATPTTINYSTTTYQNIELITSSQSLWWYLPENARGTGTATVQGDKANLFPTTQKDYCTYIEVSGLYEAGNGTYETTYKIYLGANNTNDYNVKRNTVYNVNTTIHGIEAADTRINNVDKSIIIGVFGGWDETKQEYTKLLEVQTHTKYIQKAWAIETAVNTVSNATNKEYGKTNINILKPNISNYPAAQYCDNLGNGWYLPSQNQLMAIWAANNGIPSNTYSTGTHWCSTEKSTDKTWFVRFIDGYTDANPKGGTDLVRCVRDINSPTAVLPMVINDASNRAIIDARSMPAGAITKEPKAQTTDGDNGKSGTNDLNNIGSAENNKTVSHYFEVMKSDLTKESVVLLTWIDAINACKSYDDGTWRLPTQRELMLIWTMQKSLIQKTGLTSFNTTYLHYWGATELADKGSVVSFANGFASYESKTETRRVRCIRDLTAQAVTINNLEWAVGHLVADGKGGCKIGAPTDGGLYFQFGSLVGWSGGANGDGTGQGRDLTNPVVAIIVQPTDCSYSYSTAADWTNTAKIWQGTTGTVPQPAPRTTGTSGIGDPCRYYLGGTWRLPTQTEYCALFGQSENIGNAGFKWEIVNAIGWEKTGGFTQTDYGAAKHTKSGLQFPTSGHRAHDTGALNYIGSYGYSLTSTPTSSGGNCYYLRFWSDDVFPGFSSYRSNGFPVRCVRDRNP